MNLRDLRYVVAVADLGHFGRAAKACSVSQPTLSGQLLKLEEELQVKIFERIGKSVRTTPVGDQILAFARRAVAASDDIVATARASRDPLVGEIRLGVIPTLAPYLMAHVLPIAAEKLPTAPLVIYEETTAQVLERLGDGGLDAALIATDPENDLLHSCPLFDDTFLLAMPHDHHLAKRDKLTVRDIDATALLLLADGHCLRDQALELCGDIRRSGDRQRPTGQRPPTDKSSKVSADVRGSSLETLLHLVAAGYGITFVPRLAWSGRPAFADGIVVREIADKRARRRVRLVWRKGLPRQAAIEVLSSIVLEAAPPSVEALARSHATRNKSHAQ